MPRHRLASVLALSLALARRVRGPSDGARLGRAVAALDRRDLAGLATVLGLAVGWAATLGLHFASPRQLAERLPLLALSGSAAALPLAFLAAGRAWRTALGAGQILAAGAW